ncbi:hypothetical protein T4D_6725 [Trichinella pseudospiralis]|uniref:Uncharacterized protein n=1 Tax=Trichinella pseudospiralis TaxID=6337 RepID=A0A0V1F7D8_TRIPS|nr:hypothetical protein T4D_6725 [Trichinella pseudospiralis]
MIALEHFKRLKDNCKEANLISVISSFTSKLALFKRNLGRREFYQFSSVAALRENEEVHDDDIQINFDHLDVLQKDMEERFQDILKMKIPNWVIEPFSNTDEIEIKLEEELIVYNFTVAVTIELQTNEELKLKFMENGKLPSRLLAFLSSYLVERGFSVVTDFLTKRRSRLQIVKRGDLRLFLTNTQLAM